VVRCERILLCLRSFTEGSNCCMADMMWIMRDVVEKPIVVSIAHSCKSFCVDRTQFRAFTTMDKCFNSFSLILYHLGS